jgi:hypothetical protein
MRHSEPAGSPLPVALFSGARLEKVTCKRSFSRFLFRLIQVKQKVYTLSTVLPHPPAAKFDSAGLSARRTRRSAGPRDIGRHGEGQSHVLCGRRVLAAAHQLVVLQSLLQIGQHTGGPSLSKQRERL